MPLPIAQSDFAASWVALAVVVVVAPMVGYLIKSRQASKLKEVHEAQRAADLRAHVSDQLQQGTPPMNEHDRVMFEQHKRINDLTIAKLEADVALLQNQIRERAHDDDRMHASKEYHELMVEKARLEIDSLRLHIVEQRKRLDDWRSGHE